MILDGKAIAEELYVAMTSAYAALPNPAHLGIVVVGDNPVIESFVRIKMKVAERIRVEIARVNLSETAATAEVVAAVKEIAAQSDAVIVQLPLPQQVDTDAVLAAIPPEKDVDAINPTIADDVRPVHAPVALAVVEILRRSNVDPKDMRVVVVGNGRLVGAPAASLLVSLGARVSFFTHTEGSVADLKDADIIVSGAGNPGFIKPSHIKDGVVLIDAGTSEQSGKVVGDADPACAEKCSIFTPVPGGVGPIAVAMIFRNLLDLAKKI